MRNVIDLLRIKINKLFRGYSVFKEVKCMLNFYYVIIKGLREKYK